MLVKTKTSTYVLGVGLSHDGSACLIKDGKVCVAIEKERITRQKHDGFNDFAAVDYCLRAEGITIDDLDLVVQNANFGNIIASDWWNGPRPFRPQTHIVTISHHLAHAYSALGMCPYQDGSLFVLDGCGSPFDECIDVKPGQQSADVPDDDLQKNFYEKDSYYSFIDGEVKTVFKDFSPWGLGNRNVPIFPPSTLHSIGGVYAAASTYIFGGLDDVGKLMGLAPYGRAGTHSYEAFRLVDGRCFVNYDWMQEFTRPSRSFQDLQQNFQYYADIAIWVQKEVERAVLYLLRSRHAMMPSDRLAYAGGVALNAVANKRLLEETPFREIYIQPAAGDNGLAVGCAYYGWLKVLGFERVLHSGSPYLGKSYSTQDYAQSIKRFAPQVHTDTRSDCVKAVAEVLADGKIVGWFQGGAEFGPRALGNRSILADPRAVGVRDIINSKIKFREDFRPFAPAVLSEHLSDYFEESRPSPYMLSVAKVRPERREQIPSVTHVDGTARLQTVDYDQNPLFYELIRQFYELTSVPMLLNTSLNRRGMPIVETPDDALAFFLACGLDYLVLGSQFISRADVKLEGLTEISVVMEELRSTLLINSDRLRARGGVFRLNIASTQSWLINCFAEQPYLRRDDTDILADLTVNLTQNALDALFRSPAQIAMTNLRSGDIALSGNVTRAADLLSIFDISFQERQRDFRRGDRSPADRT